jgi:hypothetical protein
MFNWMMIHNMNKKVAKMSMMNLLIKDTMQPAEVTSRAWEDNLELTLVEATIVEIVVCPHIERKDKDNPVK